MDKKARTELEQMILHLEEQVSWMSDQLSDWVPPVGNRAGARGLDHLENAIRLGQALHLSLLEVVEALEEIESQTQEDE